MDAWDGSAERGRGWARTEAGMPFRQRDLIFFGVCAIHSSHRCSIDSHLRSRRRSVSSAFFDSWIASPESSTFAASCACEM